LTSRERLVAALTAQGLSNREIAGELICGVETVRTHQENIREKMGARNRVQVAVAWSRAEAVDSAAGGAAR
jgi:DNA-binding CsgD family transcriptional regulator